MPSKYSGNFALKSKLPFGSELSPKLWLKLYESIIVPIITYSSEIWIADFNTNLNNLDKTPFEKIQNFIFKNILGVHNKASIYLAVKIELGKIPLFVKIFQLASNYLFRLEKLFKSKDNSNLVLKNAFCEDTKLAYENKKCWQGTIKQLQTKLNINLDETSNKVSSSLCKQNF